MCGRFALTLPKDAVRDFFRRRDGVLARDGLLGDPDGAEASAPPRYNIRPTQPIWVVAADAAADGGAAAPGRVLSAMRWGFIPHWARAPNDGPLLINARSETLLDKPAFKKAALERRCLIPADGFFEWRASAGRGKEPHWIYPAKGGPIAFAGVWRVWRGLTPEGGEIEIPSVAIVTCAANAVLAPLHERAPVVVAPEHFGLWLGEEGKGASLLMAAADDDFFRHHAVSRRINKGGAAAPDDAGLIAPAPAASEGSAGASSSDADAPEDPSSKTPSSKTPSSKASSSKASSSRPSPTAAATRDLFSES